jgi:PAS domain S-box-containing protein
LEEITLFYHLEYFGIPFLSTYYLMFALHFTGRSKWLTTTNKILLFTIPITTLVLVISNENHHLFYKSEEMNNSGPFPSFAFVPAVWYYVHQAYVILNMLFSLVLLGNMLKNAASVYRQQIVFLLLATTFPFVGYLAYQLNMIPFGIDPVSFTFTLSGMVVYYALVRLKLFELVPIARSKLFEKIQDRVLVFDLNDRLIDYNLSASKQFSLTRKELGKEISVLLADWTELMQFIQHNHSGKIVIHPDQAESANYYDIQILELVNDNKIKQGKLVVVKDISDLINTERERNYAATKLDAVINAMPDIILVINNKGIFTDFFASETERLLLNREEVIGASLNHLFNPEEAEVLTGLLQSCLVSNKLVTHQFEMDFPGDVLYYEARLTRLDLTHVLVIIRDVSESVKMKKDLLYQSGFQQILTNLASRFIYIAELEYDEVINDSLRQVAQYIGVERSYIFRYDLENETMSNTHEWCSQNAVPRHQERQLLPTSLISIGMSRHLQGKPSFEENLGSLDPKNPLLSFVASPDVKSILTIPMISQKNCLGFVGFDTIRSKRKWSDSDISSLKIFTGMLASLLEKISIEQSLAEASIKAEASNRLKTAFMNNISHEIRTPLNGIIGFGEIIANEQLSMEEKNRFLTVVQESSERLIHTIDDYLDISMIVTGNQEIHPKSFSLTKLILEVVEEFSEPCSVKNITITAEIPGNLRQLSLNSDPDLIRKVLHHLVGNALKFTLNGSIQVGIESNEGKVTIYVRDTGIGISEEAQKLIFDSFMQEDFSSTRQYEGSGLGLFIVKGIVTLLHGEITVTSTKGKGSEFILTFNNQA